MYELNEFRIMLAICVPSILLLAFAPIGWMISSFCSAFKEDATSPSLLVSYIKTQAKWYVSITRYKGKYAVDKETLYKAYHPWLMIAMGNLFFQWLYHWRMQILPVQAKKTRDKIASLFKRNRNRNEYVKITATAAEIEAGLVSRQLATAMRNGTTSIIGKTKEEIIIERFEKWKANRTLNAKQTMFMHVLLQWVIQNGPIKDSGVLYTPMFSKIGNPGVIFNEDQYGDVLLLASTV